MGIKGIKKGLGVLTAATALSFASGTASAEAGEWEFSLSPLFLWGLSVDGDATISGQTAPLDLGFTDEIWDNMEGVFTVHFEARRDDWSFFTELQYIDLQPDIEAQQGPIKVKGEVDFDEVVWELGAGWAFYESERTRWELIGGGRYTDEDVEIDLNLSVGPGEGKSNRIKGGDDWWHGFAGVRVAHAFTERWSFISRADLGYGGSDNSAANFSFMFDYRFRDWGSAFFGGRWLGYDYESSSYGFDATKAGPVAGITLYW